jgi:hypothetical protein
VPCSARLAAIVTWAGIALLGGRGRVASADEAATEAGTKTPEAVAESRLERIRSSPELGEDAAAVDALAQDARSFPPGRVRVEAEMFVAEAWIERMRRVDDGIAELRAVRDDPEVDPLTARVAEREIVDALDSEGRLDDAAAEASSHRNRLDPAFVKRAQKLVSRRALRHAAMVVLAAFAVLAGAALARARLRGTLGHAARALRRLAPLAAGFAAYVACAGGVLSSRYESGNAVPFVALGLAVLPLVLLARAWGAVGATGAAARIGRATLCAMSVLAVAFVLLDTVNPAYLEGFGL